MGYSEMKGKTLVISGGTRGIGKAIVYDFANKVLILHLHTIQTKRWQTSKSKI